MTAQAATRLRSFTDRSPVSRSYRRFLGRASLTMLALVIVSAYLLPLLYMVTTALQQPEQRTTAGAPLYPAAPVMGTYQGQPYPVYEVYGKLTRVTDRFLTARVAFLGHVPRDENLQRALMAQRPVVDVFPRSPCSRALQGIATSLLARAPDAHRFEDDP